jgi:hypothetical protein
VIEFVYNQYNICFSITWDVELTTPCRMFFRSLDDVKELFKTMQSRFRKRCFVISRTFTISPENYWIISIIFNLISPLWYNTVMFYLANFTGIINVSSHMPRVSSSTSFPLPGTSLSCFFHAFPTTFTGQGKCLPRSALMD